MNQTRRMWVEVIVGWGTTVGELRSCGVKPAGLRVALTAAAFNSVRLASIQRAPSPTAA